jgi:hypothetical protein
VFSKVNIVFQFLKALWVMSVDRGGQRPRPTMRSPKNSCSIPIVFAVWAVISSCWNQQTIPFCSNREVNWIRRFWYVNWVLRTLERFLKYCCQSVYFCLICYFPYQNKHCKMFHDQQTIRKYTFYPREYTLFAPAELLRNWRQQRCDLDLSNTGEFGKVYYTRLDLLLI